MSCDVELARVWIAKSFLGLMMLYSIDVLK